MKTFREFVRTRPLLAGVAAYITVGLGTFALGLWMSTAAPWLFLVGAVLLLAGLGVLAAGVADTVREGRKTYRLLAAQRSDRNAR